MTCGGRLRGDRMEERSREEKQQQASDAVVSAMRHAVIPVYSEASGCRERVQVRERPADGALFVCVSLFRLGLRFAGKAWAASSRPNISVSLLRQIPQA